MRDQTEFRKHIRNIDDHIVKFRYNSIKIYGDKYIDVALECSESRQFARGCLSNNDPRVQTLALSAFISLWRLDEETIVEICKLVNESPSQVIRCHALFVLGSNTDAEIAKSILKFLLTFLEGNKVNMMTKLKVLIYYVIIIQSRMIRIWSPPSTFDFARKIDFLDWSSDDPIDWSLDFNIDESFIARINEKLR